MTRRRKHNFRPPNEYEETDEKETRRLVRDQNLLPRANWLLVVAVFGLAYLIVNYYDDYRPPVIPASDYTQFSEERARTTTVELSEIGPRPSGSEALEVAAFEFITGKIAKIAELKEVNRLELDIQRPSACFDVDFISPFTNCYHKVSNIVVRMGPAETAQSNHSFLLNCHYDTQPDAPGATDDAVSCAVMLDIMEILARGEIKLNNDVIFLFNGAEESGLQAAHGFITQHPWRHSVRAFINLEGAGSGGREILFQTGPGNPWLSEIYVNSVPHPSCSILGQELFQAKVIPSDTDFRIFRDFGRVSGLDIAYYRNGWVYHTEFDQHFRIQKGDIQRTGENILALVRGLDTSEYIAQPGNFEDKTKTVFFDLLGKVVFKFSLNVAIMVNIVTVLWSVFCIAKNHNPYFYRALATSFAMTFLPSGLVIVFSARLFGFQFFWHKAIWQVYIFYFFTHVFWGLYVNCCWLSDDKKVRLEKAKAYHDAFLAILTVLLVLAMLPQKLNGSSIYLSLFLLAAKSKDLFQFVFRRLDLFNKERSLFYSILLSHIPFAILHFYLTSLLLYLMVPIMGRTGMKIPDPDMLIFFATNILSSIFIWSLTPLVQLTDWRITDREESFLARHKTIWIYFTIVIGLLSFTSLGTSYQFDEAMPKLRRIHAIHMDRTIYNFDGSVHEQESGILIQGLDFRKGEDLPRDDEDFARMKGIDCSRFTNYGDEACALPFVVPKYTIFRPEHAKLIPTGRVQFSNPIDLRVVSRRFVVAEGERRLRIEFELRGGADKMGIHVSPTDLYGIANSSLTHDRAVLNRNLAINTTYFATLDHGAEHPEVRKFWFELATRKTNPMHDPEKKKNLEIVVVSLFPHGPHQHTPELRAFRDKIHEKRKEKEDWRWLMTLTAASAEVKAFYF